MTTEETKGADPASALTAELAVCGICFSNDGSPPHDLNGCILPDGHEGPHEFVCTLGTRYRWETDYECTCESCRTSDDWRSTYWRVPANARVQAAAEGGRACNDLLGCTVTTKKGKSC